VIKQGMRRIEVSQSVHNALWMLRAEVASSYPSHDEVIRMLIEEHVKGRLNHEGASEG